MSYRMLAFLTKNPSLTTERFRDYYEHNHIPLIICISGDKLPTTSRRRYMHLDKNANTSPKQYGVMLKPSDGGEGVGYDCMTELVFEDREDSMRWMEKFNAVEEVRRDEEVFLDRGRMLVVVVEEFETVKEGKWGSFGRRG